MIVQCTHCGSRFEIADEYIGSSGRKLKCAQCRQTFFQSPQAKPEELPQPELAAPPSDRLASVQASVTTFLDLERHFRMSDLSVRQRADIIDKTRWSTDFEWEDIEVLAKFLSAYKVPKGTTIFHQGDTKRFMALVIKGEIEILKEDSKRQKRVLAVIGSEKTLGEMALIDGHPRSATAVASKETILFVLTLERFQELADSQPKVWGRLLLNIANLMSQRLRLTSGELVDHIHGGAAQTSQK